MVAQLVLKMATYPDRAGRTITVKDEPFIVVETVPYDQDADIIFKKYTRDYSKVSDRKFTLPNGRRFSTIEAAVLALKKERHIG